MRPFVRPGRPMTSGLSLSRCRGEQRSQGGAVVAHRKQVVETYIEGFRRGDHSLVLSGLSPDVVWQIHGQTTITGKDAFDAAIESEAFVGNPELELHRLVEEDNVVVAVGGGRMTPLTGDPVRFVFAEVFTFDGNMVSRLE